MPTSAAFSQVSMILGIDVNALARSNYTGVERYVFELVREMMKIPLQDGERVFLYSSEVIEALGELPQGWEWKVLKLPIIAKGWTHIRLSFELLVSPPDIFFSPAHEIPLLHRKAKIVNTIHDVAFVHVPEVYTFFNRMRQRWAVGRSVKLSNRILAVSKTTKQDLEQFYKVQSDRISVTCNGVRVEEFKADQTELDRVLEKYNLNAQKYFFTVGRIEKKKGIDFLIKAFEEFMRQHRVSDMNLVLGGKMGNGQAEIQAQIERSEFSDRIRVLGFVPQEDLAPLIIGAAAYIFPSRYEGFGIPALEAMAAGAPVIASDIPALREVCADAALIESIDSIQGWVNAMAQVQDNKVRLDLIEKGGERVQDFNWQETAKKTWEALRSV